MIWTSHHVLIFCNLISVFIEYHLLPSYNNCSNILWHRAIFYDVLRLGFVVRMANTRSLTSPLEQLPTWRPQAKPKSLLSAQCSVPPRLALFNLFTPTPGPLGHNSSVIVFFWENKPGSWLPQNCLLLVLWLVRWGQLWPLIGHTAHLGTEHQRSHILPSRVWCLLQQSTFSLSRQQRVTSLPSWSSMSLIFWVIAESFRWDEQPPGLALNWVHFLGVKLEQ